VRAFKKTPHSVHCASCGAIFFPEPRAAGRQHYCRRPECRKASKRASQDHWLEKGANQNYHSGPEHSARVQAWRLAHPAYWRKSKGGALSIKGEPSPEALSSLIIASALQEPCDALQDSWNPHVIALVGLISRVRGTASQEIIADELTEIMMAGHAILGDPPKGPGAAPRDGS